MILDSLSVAVFVALLIRGDCSSGVKINYLILS